MSEVIKKMLRDGEFMMIGNDYQYKAEEHTSILSGQIALNICDGKSILGADVRKNLKILVLNFHEKKERIFDIMINQSKDVDLKRYDNIKFLNVDPEIFTSKFEVDMFAKKIANYECDVIIWDNINIIHDIISNHIKKKNSFEKPLEEVIFIIKKVSGMRTKIIPHLYSNILEKEHYEKINDLASCTLTLSHENIVSGYEILMESKHSNEKMRVKLNKDKDILNIKEIQVFSGNIQIKHEKYEKYKRFGDI